MDLMDYDTNVQSKTMEKENALFFQVSFINNLRNKKFMKFRVIEIKTSLFNFTLENISFLL